jgi:hypothetical protein
VLKEHVVYVHRWPDETGVWQPRLICRKPTGGYEIVTALSRRDITQQHNYQWHRASNWNDVIVVPTDRGIMLIRPERLPMEVYHQFITDDQFAPDKYSQPQALIDWRGLIAWMPWENDKLGSRGAARFVNEKWTTLDSSVGWPDRLLHLVPMLDGSVLQLVVGQDRKVECTNAALDPAPIDEAQVRMMVEQLSHPSVEKRNAAFNELTRWGPGVWPVLEKLRDDQPPEAQVRLSQLLAPRSRPALGGLLLEPGPMSVLTRAPFATMLYSEAGVRLLLESDEEPPLVAPAWITLVPGRAITLASTGLVEELKVKGRELANVRGEWIVLDDAEGPRWWISNHLGPPLLKPSEMEFKHLIGQDHRGRWLFRREPDELSPTLIIDPCLPDPTPRLPVWVYMIEDGQVGWNAENWPAIKRGGAWALVNNDWKPIDEKAGEKFLTADEPVAEPVEPVPTTAATAPSTQAAAPTTAATSAPALGPPILVEADGTRFFDGQQTLRKLNPDGSEVVWPLPPEAIGSSRVHLLRAGEARLFLFNTPGRALRLRETPDEREPFKLEATFTRHIPNDDEVNRLWLDPAGRIVIAYGGNALAICFPSGRIPPEIAKLLTAKQLQEAEQ